MTEYPYEDLLTLGRELFRAAGMETGKAEVTARLLLEADLLGHTTHGYQLIGPYIKTLQSGAMRGDGEPKVLQDRGATIAWDGDYLPGLWLTDTIIDAMLGRIDEHGVVSASVARSGHIGGLSVFLRKVTERGCLIGLCCSDPSVASVAPYGGIDAVYTPNPIGVGIPTLGDPILIDTSMSICSNGRVMQTGSTGDKLPGPWLLDAEGNPSDEPSALTSSPPGTVMPVGGVDHGYKGFAFGLIVEALSQGLSGYTRADDPDTWGCGLFIQIMDPGAFGEPDQLARQSDHLVRACRASRPQRDFGPVRIPGEAAQAKRRKMLDEGRVALHPEVVQALEKWTERLGIESSLF